MASDEDSNEDFVTYGTPLEPLEEDEPIRKPIPVHEQTVKDEKGRYKRFHGAFAGGFSAGYFNTVGSKEGWTPSTFVSSRQQKAEKQNARPEDFMDEEDFGEHGIAPQEIVTTSDFASERRDQIKDKARAVNFLAAPIPGDTGLLEELIAPARSSIGVQLLRKMGWKDGQGVGPRLKRKQSKQNLSEKSAGRSYGCALPPNGSEESEDDDDDEFAPENVTFAPKDVIPVDFTPKVDSHGLGYRGLNPLQALSGGSGSGQINLFMLHSDKTTSLIGDKKSGQQRRGGIAGQAFGVGAMEDEDDDIYHKDSMSNYDAVLGGEEPGDGLYGWTAPQQYTKKKNELNRDAAYLGRILEGFTLASKVTAEMKTVYPPPDLPRDYRPVHYFRPVVDSSSVSPVVAQALQASRGYLSQDAPKQGRHTLDSSQRRELLGETSLQGPSSVFELLGSKERERLNEIRRASTEQNRSERDLSSAVDRAAVVASAKAAVLQALSSRFQSAGPQSDSQTQSLSSQSQPQSSSEMQMALNAWSGPTADASKTFKPFAKNPQKQARYDLYISRLKQGDRDAVETSLDSSMTEWERGREREEFVRAALLYKPTNSSLSSRFTRAKHEDDTDSVEVTQEQENDVDDKQAAVKMKMFGKLTRETFEWHPDKLLCKRFNIPDPYPGSSTVGMPKVKRDKYSVFNFLTIPESSQVISAAKPPSTSTALPHTASNKKSRWDVPEQASKTQDPLSALLSEARSEVSTAQHAATRVKSQTDSPNTSEVPSTAPSEEQQSEQKTEKEEEKDEDEEEEEEEEVRPPMDLFKAIFASSSDEKSSSSSEDDSGEEEEENTTSEPSKSSAGRLDPSITIQDTPVPDISKVTDITHLKTQSVLSATDITEQTAQSSEKAPAKSGDLDEEEFGPRLPPPGLVLPAYSSQSKKQKKKDKEKHKAKKDHKHKKEKKKKKNKKHKHKGKHKKRVEESNSSSDDSDSNSEDESRDVSTSELLLRLKNLRDKRS